MKGVEAGGDRLEVAEQSFVRSGDGREVHHEVKTVPITFEGRPAMLSIARDITARVEAERAAARALHEADLGRRKLEAVLVALIVSAAFDVAQPTLYAMGIIIAALIPVFSLERVEGRIFRPLAMTYSLALVAALVLAMTSVPAMLAVVLRSKETTKHEPRWLVASREAYGTVAAWALRVRAVPLAAALAVLVLAGVVGGRMGTEFLPALDEGDIVVFVEMPASISLEGGQRILQEVRRRMLAFPEVMATMSEHGRPEDGTDNEGVNMSETFLRLARGAEPALERVDAAGVARDAAALVRHRYTKAGVGLRVDPDDAAVIRGDRRLLEHALVNLLLNACDACARGGAVRLRVHHDAASVYLEVDDDGVGVGPDLAARVTEPFFSTKPAGRGTGLGLAIASEIVKIHRGALSLTPLRPRGTRAVICIPAASVAAVS